MYAPEKRHSAKQHGRSDRKVAIAPSQREPAIGQMRRGVDYYSSLTQVTAVYLDNRFGGGEGGEGEGTHIDLFR